MMASTSGRGRWPADDEFKSAMESGSQYGRKWTREILVRIEEGFGHKENADVSLCTIEHVMPQSLSEDWIKALDSRHLQIHEALLHTFGNLTLSAYNLEMGNQSFADKRLRLKESHLELNRWIAAEERWGEAEIKHRAAKLFSIAAKIWSGPNQS